MFEVVLSISEREGVSVSFQYKCCIEMRFLRCSCPKNLMALRRRGSRMKVTDL